VVAEMIFRYFGFNISTEQLLRDLPESNGGGYDIFEHREQITRKIPANDFRSQTRFSNIDEVATYTGFGIPVIAYVWE